MGLQPIFSIAIDYAGWDDQHLEGQSDGFTSELDLTLNVIEIYMFSRKGVWNNKYSQDPLKKKSSIRIWSD